MNSNSNLNANLSEALNLSKTLQAKYPHLQVSVFDFKKVSKYLILGAEFNSNARENALQNLRKNSSKKVNDYFALKSAAKSAVNEPVYVYDLTHSLGNFMSDVELSNENFGSNKKEVFAGDFVISRLRSYLQEMAVIQPKKFRQFLSTEYLVYRPKTKDLSSNTLMVFALTKNVQTILNNSQYGTEHPRFYEFVFDEMPIPSVLLELNSEIDAMMQQAYQLLENSKNLYKEAERLLYEALGLDFTNPIQSLYDTANPALKSINFTIRSLKESYLATGRIDSEYYQEKYDLIESKIKAYNDGYCRLCDSEIKDTNFTPNDLEKYHYIELANIGGNGNISEPLECLGVELPTRARRRVKTGDFIMSSIEGSLSSCAIITQDFDNFIVSTGFYVLNSRELNSETLLVLFKCEFFQEYLAKFPSGTILTAITKDELKNILIPKIDKKTQELIAHKIQNSFALRKEAKNLLAQAVSKIENAIC